MLTDAYINRFGGIGRLYGKNALESFYRAHVMVVGLGGVGSWTVESLARSGIGKLTLVDMDEICITNTNRQLPAHEGNYGKMKAEALTERIKTINPDCEVITETTFYSERNSDQILSSRPDVVIDAIDAIKAKCYLLAECQKQKIPVCSCGGAGGKKDASKIQITDLSQTYGDKLASSVRQKLRKEYRYPSGEGKKPKKFKIPTVFSPEEITAPQPCMIGETDLVEHNTPKNLNCATGYGAATHVTATFGLFLTQLTLDTIQKNKLSTSLVLK